MMPPDMTPTPAEDTSTGVEANVLPDPLPLETPVPVPQNDFYTAATAENVSIDMSGDISQPVIVDAKLPDVMASGSDDAASDLLKKKGYGWMLELDEEEEEQKPLLEELDIDLKDIWLKVRCVMVPVDMLGFKREIVRDSPDFWGPLLVVCLYAMLSMYGNWGAASWIITIWFFGSFIIYFLVRAMGADVSFSQTLGVIGYSLLPLCVMMLLLPLVANVGVMDGLLKILGTLWSSQSAGSLLVTEAIVTKRILVLYPIALLYGYFLSLNSGV
eukprot:m.24409 g.24409  ORF g.24409 m.24409 type:complete len:272 (+) comp14591_c0_seq1:318-1133(+)